MQAVTEVLNKSHYGNSRLQMRQNPITIAEHFGLIHFFHISYSKKDVDFFRPMMFIYEGIQVQRRVRQSWGFPFRSPRITLSTTTIGSTSSVWPL